MAVNFNAGTGSSNNNASNEDWKADAFLNFFYPTKTGGRKQIGKLPMKLSKDIEKFFIEKFDADIENVQKFMNSVQVEYVRVNKNAPEIEFDL